MYKKCTYKNRLEAFSDNVITIIFTILVLAVKVPHNTSWQFLWNLWPVFISYALSFVFVGLYRSSHHNLFHMAVKVNSKILCANMLGPFFLSFTLFATAWRGQNTCNKQTITLYAITLTLCVVSYLVLVDQLRYLHGYESNFSKTFKGYTKIYLTIALNSSAAFIAFIGFSKVAFILLIIISFAWFIPNHRFENHSPGQTP